MNVEKNEVNEVVDENEVVEENEVNEDEYILLKSC